MWIHIWKFFTQISVAARNAVANNKYCKKLNCLNEHLTFLEKCVLEHIQNNVWRRLTKKWSKKYNISLIHWNEKVTYCIICPLQAFRWPIFFHLLCFLFHMCTPDKTIININIYKQCAQKFDIAEYAIYACKDNEKF